jgi:hypothetical protein
MKTTYEKRWGHLRTKRVTKHLIRKEQKQTAGMFGVMKYE